VKRAKLAPHERKVVIGVTGAGKSHYVKHGDARSERVVIWDPKDEYADDCEEGVPGVERVTLADFAARLDADDGDEMRLAVVPEWADPAELCDEFRAFAALVKTARDVTLIVDEVALLRGAEGSLVMLAVLSRAWGVPMVMLAQRAVSIPKTAREQASWIVSFRQSSPDDIDALSRVIGEEKAARVAKLPRRECIEWRETEAFES
jgi:hypothetical protein